MRRASASTDVEVLEELAALHPLPAKIVEFRQYAKLKGTYVDALPDMIYPQTGRVHASFNQVVAATGRLSSSDPNLQNIPIRTEEGREIRAAFVPGQDGWLLLAADYSQIELRVLAHFSQDQALCDAFARDEDIHARVASQVYHVPLDAVTPEMRRKAKAVNFGVIYGQTPFGLAKQLRRSAGVVTRPRPPLSSTPTSRATRESASSSIACWRIAPRTATSRRSSGAAGRSPGSGRKPPANVTWPSGRPSTP